MQPCKCIIPRSKRTSIYFISDITKETALEPGTIIKYKYVLPNNWIYIDYLGQTGFINANQININENFNKDNMSKLAFVVENTTYFAVGFDTNV